MKTAAVIAELNPCHAGHAYFLQEVRRQSGADCVIAVMSGDFVQRGEPAVFDKYVRTDMALRCGADLVLELPAASACSSAQRFAEGAAAILDRLQIVDELWFGSEAGTIGPFLEVSEAMLQESPLFRSLLKEALAEGLSFPAAREQALTSTVSSLSVSDQHGSTLPLSQPNDILGLEYCLALQKAGSSIQPRTLQRTGSPYNSRQLPHSGFASATAIRKQILGGCSPASFAGALPEQLLPLYDQTLCVSAPVCSDDFSSMLLYQLRKETPESLCRYLDLPEDLANRISHTLDSFSSFSAFAQQLKTKNRTLAQIRRALLHVLLGITPEDLEHALQPEYTRVLGFSSAGSALLSSIKERGQITLVTKASALSSFSSERDVFASRLYESVRSVKAGVPALDEFRRGVITN